MTLEEFNDELTKVDGVMEWAKRTHPNFLAECLMFVERMPERAHHRKIFEGALFGYLIALRLEEEKGKITQCQ